MALSIEHNVRAFWGAYDGIGDRAEPDHALAFFSECPFGLLNPVTAFRAAPDEADAIIARLIGEAERRGVDQWWWGGPSDEPADLGDRLVAAGLNAQPPSPGMVRSLEGWLAPEAPAGLEVVPVTDDGFDELMAVFHDGFGLPEPFRPAMGAMYRAVSRDTRVQNFLGRLDGEPVACATLVVDDAGTAGVWNVATLEHARGRGVGTALTAVPMAAGALQGAARAILVASPLGEPVYRSMGFETVCEMPMWTRS